MKVYFTKDRDDKRSETIFKMIEEEGGPILFVPKDEGNRHYQMIQEWVAAGNQIEEEAPQAHADAPQAPTETPVEGQ